METIEFDEELSRYYATEFTWFLRELEYLECDPESEEFKCFTTQLRDLVDISRGTVSDYYLAKMSARFDEKYPGILHDLLSRLN